MESGIQKLLETPLGSTVQYLVADEAAWAKWAWSAEAELWQLVALHSHLDPDLLRSWVLLKGDVAALQANRDRPWADPELAARLLSNVERATSALQTLDLVPVRLGLDCPETSLVSMAEFHSWTIRASVHPVQGFRRRVQRPGGRFPWGNYTTPKLEQLAAACELWRLVSDGGTYVPGQDGTAPSVEVFQMRLAELGVPPSLYEVFNSFTRDPSIPPSQRARRPKGGRRSGGREGGP